MIDYTIADAVKEKIIKLFKKEQIDLEFDDIKVWSTRPHFDSILNGINHCKARNRKHIIWTTKIPMKDNLTKQYSIEVIDSEDISSLCLKHNEYELYEILM